MALTKVGRCLELVMSFGASAVANERMNDGRIYVTAALYDMITRNRRVYDRKPELVLAIVMKSSVADWMHHWRSCI